MAITLNQTRQEILSAYVDFTFADIPTTATAYKAANMPVDAVVIGGDVVVTTAWNTATSAVLDVGDVTTANRYVNDVDLKVAARTALVPTGFTVTATQRALNVTPTYVGAAATAGAARLRLDYIVKKRGFVTES